MIKKTYADRFFNVTQIGLLLVMVIGIPLALTSLTYSIFEVNKLALLRVTTILCVGFWLLKSVVYDHNNVEFKGSLIRWRKMGLEIPLLLWFASIVLSTVFSENVRISVFGVYDRWEGLLTVVNYAVVFVLFSKLIETKKQLFWVLGASFAAAAISGVYGVFQSFGIDYFYWSADASARVFACVNNPVHYCAYVAMLVPLGVGLNLYLAESNKRHLILQVSIFLMTSLLFYNQYLSYARAAWLGFFTAMTLFYCAYSGVFNRRNQGLYILDFFVCLSTLALFYLYFVFHLHTLGGITQMAIYAALSSLLVVMFFLAEGKKHLMDILLVGCFLAASFFNMTYSGTQAVWVHGAASVIMLLTAYAVKNSGKQLLLKLVILLAFTQIILISTSWTHFAVYFVLVSCFLLSNSLSLKKNVCLASYLIAFGLITSLPVLLFKPQLKVLDNVSAKVESYQTVAIKGSARSSMWRSSVPWIKDYWLLGSGLDTVKFMYPNYREPIYGLLEGGHQFTPDRLHNEYLNTLATRGFLGFVAYYLCFVLGWLLMTLKGLYRLQNARFAPILLATMSAALVYFGQVLFNFGVVVTLFILYAFMGLCFSIIRLDRESHA